ncbi:MAG: tRNA lysidine(34) synthetase TilS [Acidobacteria bacterium]|nr:MAG: tRNA lysidine(34) synthetase TilS [Acidobacteriota bacterium]
MIERVREFIRRHDLIRPGDRVIAAVSGGSDSVALARILHELDAAGDLRLAAIAHFNHQLRPSADADERFVGDLAASLGLPSIVEREAVAARALRERRSIEDAARAARYAFFDRARRSSGADLVALGHTRDDQAETVLLRLTRGAGPRGFAGMYPRNGAIVRPLLACRRGDLRAWLAAGDYAFVEDETNADVAIPRNRVRAELLPMLAARFNPSIVDVLADEADVARETWAWMEGEAAALEAAVVRQRRSGTEEVCEIDAAALRAAPIALQRVVLWRLLRRLAGTRAIAFQHVEAARCLLDAGHARGGRVDLPGQRLERIGGALVLTGRPAGAVGRRAEKAANLFRYRLSIPGEVMVLDGSCIVSAEPFDARRADVASSSAAVRRRADEAVALVRGDLCGGSLVVRNRRPGDRFRPVGLAGRKKLQDYFVDRKIARELRDRVPLVVDASDRIVWVAGHQIDAAFRVTDRSQPVLILSFKAVGGSA